MFIWTWLFCRSKKSRVKHKLSITNIHNKHDIYEKLGAEEARE